MVSSKTGRISKVSRIVVVTSDRSLDSSGLGRAYLRFEMMSEGSFTLIFDFFQALTKAIRPKRKPIKLLYHLGYGYSNTL